VQTVPLIVLRRGPAKKILRPMFQTRQLVRCCGHVFCFRHAAKIEAQKKAALKKWFLHLSDFGGIVHARRNYDQKNFKWLVKIYEQEK
jgi:cytochrome c556